MNLFHNSGVFLPLLILLYYSSNKLSKAQGKCILVCLRTNRRIECLLNQNQTDDILNQIVVSKPRLNRFSFATRLDGLAVHAICDELSRRSLCWYAAKYADSCEKSLCFGGLPQDLYLIQKSLVVFTVELKILRNLKLTTARVIL